MLGLYHRRQTLLVSRRLIRMVASKPPANWKASAPPPPAGSVTNAEQDKLPRLPVPELPNTFARLRRSLKPLAWSEEEYTAVDQKISEFENGLATELQRRLLERQRQTEHWLEEWWDAGSYNGYRDSVVVNVSYFYGFDEHPSHYPQTSVHRAAALTRGILLFRQLYRRGLLKPEATREGPICMDTYRWMFDCCRVPGLDGLDWSTSYATATDTGDSGHIIVLRKGRVWKLDIAPYGRILSTSDLENQFRYIYDNTTSKHAGVGVLTASNRDVWAKDHTELASDPHNTPILRDIHSSAFVVCLDTTTPKDIPAFSLQLWVGGAGGVDLTNRWVDKPVQLIVCDGEGARAGVMGEHSVMDGTPMARMCDEVLDMVAEPAFDHGDPVSSALEPPIPLDWHVSPATERAIVAAKDAARQLVDSQALGYFLTSYGKEAIKSFGVSPDSWAQMIIQLAYARLLRSLGKKREGGTYEAASTRRFHKGRTEAIRVVTTETDTFVRAMDEEGVEDETIRDLFQNAARRHIQLAREAGNGQGVDRHMLGLRKLIAEGEETPELYSDPLFVRSSNWVLSTSAVFSKHFDAYGWGEVVPEGFGVAYMTGFDDKLFFTITSRKEMPNAQFCEEIQKAATDMYNHFTRKPRL